MNRVLPDNADSWSFPDLDMNEDSSNLIGYFTLNPSPVIEKKLENQVEEPKCDPAANAAILALQAEVANLKVDYEKKIELLNKLLVQFENPLVNIDKELIELMQYIIKKSVKNIIYKEIKSDSKLMAKIIRELESLVDSKGGMITVYLSESDYSHIKTSNSASTMLFKKDAALSEGDIVINSNFTEIRAILNDRINQILGIKYV